MRIITQNVPGGTSAKILPKPSQLTTPSGAPVVVVSAGSSQNVTSTVAMLNRPITTFSGTIFNSGTNNHSAFKNLPLQIMHSFLARLHEVQKSYCSHHGRTRSRSRYRSRSRSTLLKFSRSLYLGNHSSESIHTWTIGTQ